MSDVSILIENTDLTEGELQNLIGDLGCVEVVIADPGYLKVLNRKYRRINRTTDVLSFDLAQSPEDRPEGTIFVDGRLFPPMEELLERIFHGYLHLNGYSHNNEEDAEAMKREVAELVADALGKKVQI